MAKRSGPDPFDFSNSEVLESYPWAKERALRYETENDPRNREAKGWAFIKALVDDGVELSDEDQINILNDFIRTGGTTYSVPEPVIEESVAAPVTTAGASAAEEPGLVGRIVQLGAGAYQSLVPWESDRAREIQEDPTKALPTAQLMWQNNLGQRATDKAAKAYERLQWLPDAPLQSFATPEEITNGMMPSQEALQKRKDNEIRWAQEALVEGEADAQEANEARQSLESVVGRNTALGITAEGLGGAMAQAEYTGLSILGGVGGGMIGGPAGAGAIGTIATAPTFARARRLSRYEVRDAPLTDEEKEDYANVNALVEFAPQAFFSVISGGTLGVINRTPAGAAATSAIKDVLGRYTTSRGVQLALATVAEGADELTANELNKWATRQMAEGDFASTEEGKAWLKGKVAEQEQEPWRDAAVALVGAAGATGTSAPVIQAGHVARTRQAAAAVDALTKSMENDLSIIDAVNAGMEATTRETPSGVEQPTDIPTRVDVELNQDIAFEEERIRNEESRTRAFEQAEAERKLQEEQDELSREAGLQTLERGGGSIGGGSRVERYGGPTRGTENVPGTPAARGDGIVERVEIAPAQEVRPEDVAAQREEAAAQERERQQRAEQGGRIERIRKRQEELKKKEADKQKKEESAAAKEVDDRRQTIIDQAIAENPDATPAELDQIVEARMMEPAPDPRPAQQAEALRKKIRSARGRIGRGAKPSDKAETRRIEGWLKANPDATDDQAVAALMPGAPRAAAPAPRQTAQQPSAPQQTPAPAPTKPDSEMSDAEVDAMADRYASLGMAAQEDAQGNRRVNTPENRAKAREIARALVHSSHVGSRGVQELIMQGRLKIVPNASSIGLPNKRRAAEYDVGNDMMYVYSDHLTNPSDATAAIVAGLHEATHSGQFAGSEARRELYRAFLGDDKTSQAAAILRDAAEKGNVLAAEAVRKAQADTAARQEAGEANPSRFEDLELVAYFTGEVAASRGTTLGSLGGAMRDITTAARSWVRESFPGLDLKITAGDLNTAAAFVGQEVASDARQGDSTSTVGGRANTDTGEEDEQLGMLGGAQATGFSQAQQQGRTFAPAVDRLERFEFGDDRAELTTDSTVWQAMTEGEVVPLNEVWSHPEFEEQYPDLANSLTVEVDPNMPASVYGTYLNGKISVPPTIMQALRADREDVRNTLLHEVQHAIQELEGFVPGTNKENFIPAVVSQMRDYDRQRVATMEEQFNLERAVEGLTPEARQRWEASGFADSDSAASWFMSEGYHKETSNPNDVRFGDRYQEALKNLRKSNEEYREAEQRGFRIYLRDRGEAEARNVEARSRMTQAERDALPFESTIGEDIGVDASELLDTSPFIGRPERAPIASEAVSELRETLGMGLHGTPATFQPEGDNRFGVFRDDKMGTGEGAQAVGWGHYLTEAFRVANGMYRERLLGRKSRQTWDSPELRDTPLGIIFTQLDMSSLLNRRATNEELHSRLSRALGTQLEFANNLVDTAEAAGDRLLPDLANHADNIRTAKEIVDNSTMEQLRQLLDTTEDNDSGQVYYVDISNKENLASWDAPIDEQPAAVRDALQAAIEQFVPLRHRRSVETNLSTRPFGRMYKEIAAYVNSDISLVEKFRRGLLGTAATQRSNSEQALSKFLHSNGVPGHSFRPITVAEAGYNNFVVYDPSSLTITGKEPFERGVPYRDTIRDYESRSDRLRREQEEDARQRIRDEIPSQPLELETLGMSFDPPDSPAFKSWFGDSKIKYSDGGPITMWHGSARDAADLAQRFASGENRRNLFFVAPTKHAADAFAGEGRDAMPMFVRAENPWDFAVGAHVRNLLAAPMPDGGTVRDFVVDYYAPELSPEEAITKLRQGSWEVLEAPGVLDAIKSLGHDAVYVFESDSKNLGLFSPNQMKHATDNSGEFSESGDFLGMAAAETNTSTEGFRRWWKQSVATNPDGSPRKLFHGTTSDVNFSEFRIGDAEIGIHVGTAAQANDPAFVGPIYGPGGLEVGLAQLRKGDTGGESPRVFPLYASIQNPLRVPDMFAGFAADVADGIAQGLQNVNNNSLANTILDLAFEWDRQDGRDGLATSSDVQVNKGRLAELRAALQGAGYDGLVYTNKSEGTRDIRAYPQGTATPEDSYVVFNPNQLKSTTNSGDFSRYTNDTLGMHIPTAEEAASVTKRAIVNMFRNDKGLGEDVLNLVELAKSSPAYDSMAAETLVRDYQNALDDLADERGVDSRALSREIADKLEEAAKDTTKPSENKAAWANTLAEYGKVGEVLMDMRNRADRLAIEILSLREQQGGDMTPDEVRAYKAVAANLGRYVHRMYAAGSGRAGKKFGRAMWKAHMKQQAGKTLTTTEAHNAATVERAINVLADQLTIPDNEGLYTLDQHDLESLYNTWINPSATAVDSNTMIDRLAEARDAINGDSDRIRNQAEQVAKDLLNLLKKDPTTPLGKFYRGGKLDRGILKKRKNIAAPLRELMGEIRDPGIALLGTIGKQAEFVARNKLLLKMRNMVGEDLQPPSAAGTRIQTDNEMTPLEGPDFGPLQGWYASPYMHSMLNSTVQQLATLEQAMSNINAQPGDLGDVVWRNIGNTWRQVASKTKAWTILGNPTLFLINFVGSFDTMLQNGNYTSPETQLQALREAGQLIAYAVNPALSTDSTRLLAKYGVIDNAQIGELKNMNYKQIQNHIKSLISDGGHKRNIAWGVLRGYKETYAMMDVWAKIANFHQNVKDLTAYNEAEGGKWSQDEIYQRAAASTKRTNFTYGRAAPFIKALERNGVTMFGTYFYEVFRTQAENIREIDRDLALAEEATTPEARKIMRQRAAKRGLGIAASNAIKLGAAQMLAKLLFGDDEEKWYNIRGLLPEFLRGQDFIPVGRDEEGDQVMWPFSRFDPYGPATDIVRDILHGNGSPEEITNSLRDLYITPRVASIVVSNLAGRGREPTFQQVAPGVYGEVVNIAGRRAGLVKAVTNIAEAFAPGALNSWRDNNVRIQPRENDGTIGGAVMSTVDQLALYSSYVGNRMYKLDPNESIKYAGFEYKDFDTEAKKEVKEYLKSQTEPTVENLEKLVYDITKQEYAEWEKLRRIYKGMLDIGIPEDEADAIIGESPLSKAVQASVIDGVFTPNAVSIRSLESVRDNLMKNQTAAEKERIKEKWDIMIELMSEVLDD